MTKRTKEERRKVALRAGAAGIAAWQSQKCSEDCTTNCMENCKKNTSRNRKKDPIAIALKARSIDLATRHILNYRNK